MRIRIGCAVAVLSLLCFESSEAGALKKWFGNWKKQANAESTESKKTDNNKKDEAVSASVNKKIVGNPVVARVGKKEFRREQVRALMKNIPPQLMQAVPLDKIFAMLREQLVCTYLMVQKAKELNLDTKVEFIETFNHIKDALLVRLYVMREIGPRVENEDVVKARYAKYVSTFKEGDEKNLRVIMVATEKEANEVLASVSKGEDFIKLVKAHSIAPSKAQDGDEGYVPVEIMPDDLKAALGDLKAGDYTKKAIKTPEGYLVIKVEDVRKTSPMKYEESVNFIKQMLMQEELAALAARLEKQNRIEKFDVKASDKGNAVIAKVGSISITADQRDEFMKGLPEQMLQSLEEKQRLEIVRDELIRFVMMVEQAKKAGLDKLPEYVAELERIKEDRLVRSFLQDQVESKIEENKLKERYARYKEEYKKCKEYGLSHIAVADEEGAKQILSELEKGADFGKLAHEKSVAPSKENNGDEGYVLDKLIPGEIKDKVVSMTKGSYMKESVKIGDQYHIFKLNDVRQAVPQEYEKVKPVLTRFLYQELLRDTMTALEKEANVEKFNEDGSPIAEEILPGVQAVAENKK